MLSFYYEDLADAGIILVPNGSPKYPTLLAEIQQRIETPAYDTSGWRSPEVCEHIVGKIRPDDWQTSAILLNNSGKSIASMTLLWRLTDLTGRVENHPQQTSDLLLLPSNLDEARRKMLTYWQIIMPNSKRYISLNGMAGDNSDVRLPDPDEMYQGGYFQWGGPPGNQHLPRSVKVSIDGVFFTDGEFIGPDTKQTWESTLQKAEIRKLVVDVASQAHRQGTSPDRIFAAVEEITGPVLPRPCHPPPGDEAARAEFTRQLRKHSLASRINDQRRQKGDENAIAWLLAFAASNPPQLHRR